jgi:uncharacterized protein YbbC (DUF1343 family)
MNIKLNKKTVPFCLVLFALNLLCFGAFTLTGKSSIKLGVDYLEETGFEILKGKRTGLLTHPAGKNGRGQSTVGVLYRSKVVNLVALFGPEHGIYGDEKASVPVDDKIDARTGLPVYSLYGKFRKPTAKMLAGLDCLVIDLQDVGVRCYTYVSCMRYVMEACFEAGVEVVVLDRPNPLGGLKVAGPPMDEKWMSYVGAFRMPFVHGMTIGEIALWSKKSEGVLKTSTAFRKKGKLSIVPMIGWERSMTWPETGLVWSPTSPNIPTLDSVAGYPMTGLGSQMGRFKHGIGTPHPFRFLTFEGKSPEEVKGALESFRLPGLSYKIKTLRNSAGKDVRGVYLVISDWTAWKPTYLPFYMMKLSALWETPSPFPKAKEANAALFNKHVGSSWWWEELLSKGGRIDPTPFLVEWEKDSLRFRKVVSPYLLY